MTSSSIVAVWASSRSTMPARSDARFFVGMMAATVSLATSTSRGTIELTRLGDGAPTPASLVSSIVPREVDRSEEHTSELQSPYDLVCRLLLEKKKIELVRAHHGIRGVA